MQDKINQDLKSAMLAKDAFRTNVLRSIKSAFIYAKTAPGADGSDVLSDDTVTAILVKEAKKRQESADSYTQAGQADRANDELAEKAIIQEYLPAQLSEAELKAIIEEVVATLDEVSPKVMGQVIGQVKAKAGAAADGAVVARLVKARLSEGSSQ